MPHRGRRPGRSSPSDHRTATGKGVRPPDALHVGAETLGASGHGGAGAPRVPGSLPAPARGDVFKQFCTESTASSPSREHRRVEPAEADGRSQPRGLSRRPQRKGPDDGGPNQAGDVCRQGAGWRRPSPHARRRARGESPPHGTRACGRHRGTWACGPPARRRRPRRVACHHGAVQEDTCAGALRIKPAKNSKMPPLL